MTAEREASADSDENILATLEFRAAACARVETWVPYSYDLKRGVALIKKLQAEIDRLRGEVVRLKVDDDMASGCLAMIRDALKSLGCKCGPNAHESTPAMMYPEWIGCVLHTALAEQREAHARIADRWVGERDIGENEFAGSYTAANIAARIRAGE